MKYIVVDCYIIGKASGHQQAISSKFWGSLKLYADM